MIKKLEEMLIMEEAKIVDIEKSYSEKFGMLKEGINQINLKMDSIIQQSSHNLLLDREMQLILGRLNEKFLAVEETIEKNVTSLTPNLSESTENQTSSD